MNPQVKFAVFVVGIISILAFQAKGLMPVVYDVVSSDLFLEDTEDQANPNAVTNDMTQMAFKHCNTLVKEELGNEVSIVFPENPINAWGLGNYEYVVNADVDITTANAATATKRYACRIEYDKKEDKSAIADINNWSLIGLSGLENL